MEGMIDRDGNLYFVRKGRVKPGRCHADTNRFCGDWCSLFEEPFTNDKENIVISLCKKDIVFTELKDNRLGGDDEYHKRFVG